MIALKLYSYFKSWNEIGLILSNENYLETIQSKYDLWNIFILVGKVISIFPTKISRRVETINEASFPADHI